MDFWTHTIYQNKSKTENLNIYSDSVNNEDLPQKAQHGLISLNSTKISQKKKLNLKLFWTIDRKGILSNSFYGVTLILKSDTTAKEDYKLVFLMSFDVKVLPIVANCI